MLLKNKPGERAHKVTTKTAPGWLVRLFALFNPSAKDIVAQLGRNKKASNEKAKKLLNWTPGSHEEAILAAAESLFRFGLISLFCRPFRKNINSILHRATGLFKNGCAKPVSRSKKGKKPADVYLDMGLEDLSHFSFAFKKLFGHSPSTLTDRKKTGN